MPGAKIIGFPRDAGTDAAALYAQDAGVDAVGLDWMIAPEPSANACCRRDARCKAISIRWRWSPAAPALDRAVDDVLAAFAHRPHIFNLGHGIVPETPIAHVEQMLRRVSSDFRADQREARRALAKTLMLYLWLKALHVVAVIAWMAGMLYLPRLFVYHADAPAGSDKSETFKVMERRLLRFIINPAMVVTWVVGLWLAYEGGFYKSGWFHAKFACVHRPLGPPRLLLGRGRGPSRKTATPSRRGTGGS